MESYPDDWHETADKIVSKPGKVLVLGGPDTGKTSFCRFLANKGIDSGLRVGVIDADVGQSHIGPPTTIGLGLVERKIGSLSESELIALHFVGSTSPAREVGSMVSGTQSMVAEATNKGLELIILDSTGLIEGKTAMRLKRAKIELVSPDHTVALQKVNELEGLLSLPAARDRIIHRLVVPKWVEPKSKSRRRSFRRNAWQEYFRDASLLSLPLDSLNISVKNRCKTWSDLVNCVVGLGERGGAVKVGLLRELNPEGDAVSVLAPLGEPENIVSLTVGSAKVNIETVNPKSK